MLAAELLTLFLDDPDSAWPLWRTLPETGQRSQEALLGGFAAILNFTSSSKMTEGGAVVTSGVEAAAREVATLEDDFAAARAWILTTLQEIHRSAGGSEAAFASAAGEIGEWELGIDLVLQLVLVMTVVVDDTAAEVGALRDELLGIWIDAVEAESIHHAPPPQEEPGEWSLRDGVKLAIELVNVHRHGPHVAARAAWTLPFDGPRSSRAAYAGAEHLLTYLCGYVVALENADPEKHRQLRASIQVADGMEEWPRAILRNRLREEFTSGPDALPEDDVHGLLPETPYPVDYLERVPQTLDAISQLLDAVAAHTGMISTDTLAMILHNDPTGERPDRREVAAETVRTVLLHRRDEAHALADAAAGGEAGASTQVAKKKALEALLSWLTGQYVALQGHDPSDQQVAVELGIVTVAGWPDAWAWPRATMLAQLRRLYTKAGGDERVVAAQVKNLQMPPGGSMEWYRQTLRAVNALVDASCERCATTPEALLRDWLEDR